MSPSFPHWFIALGGWSGGGVEEIYGGGMSPAALLRELRKVRYPLDLSHMHEGENVARAKVFALGFCIYICPPLFDRLMARWFPDEPREGARVLRRRFWGSLITVAGVMGAVLVFQHWRTGDLKLGGGDWLRVIAAIVAVSATLARAGWSIQSWKGTTVVERVDRAVYIISQLGVAALLVFVLTL